MYIKSITIRNIGAFDDLTLDFSSGEDVRKIVLIFGDNGVGKTTILRCLALGLCDDTSASALLTEPTMADFKRQEADEEPFIEVSVLSPKTGEILKISKTIKSSGQSGADVDVPAEAAAFPWHEVFVCGYGIARRPFAYDAYPRYRLIDSVYTLFNYDSSLWSPEVALGRLERGGSPLGPALRRMEKVLQLREGSLLFTDKGLVIEGPWPEPIGLAALGDGYSATMGWLADMLAWGLLYAEQGFDIEAMQGIVLVDMIERDLHPSWQRAILKTLREQFKGIQFICTTHAPMCAIGATALADEESQLIALHWAGDRTEAINDIKLPREDRVDEVLTSLLFGVPNVSGSGRRDMFERFAQLLARQRMEDLTAEEAKELAKTRAAVEEDLRTTSFESRVLEFLCVSNREELGRHLAKLSEEELQAAQHFVERLSQRSDM